MNAQFSESESKLDKAMTVEQFDRVVEAILAGKYSWACVLILRFAGYNPLHYIPYTTYIRLAKEDRQQQAQNLNKSPKTKESYSQSEAQRKFAKGDLGQLADLNYLEKVEEKNAIVRGGNGYRWRNEPGEGNRPIATKLSFYFKGSGDELRSRLKVAKLYSKNGMDEAFPSTNLKQKNFLPNW
ncbi:MAG: HetP family heterocyst commitment protein [Hydrococcus sp. Prado102]|jgi:hypothetical protein|nr:HetP family heterocyst commitment protein [Hydrococcus sp. Prado102]